MSGETIIIHPIAAAGMLLAGAATLIHSLPKIITLLNAITDRNGKRRDSGTAREVLDVELRQLIRDDGRETRDDLKTGFSAVTSAIKDQTTAIVGAINERRARSRDL